MVVHTSMRLRREIASGQLKPLIIMDLVPLCSWQYMRLFGTTRIPGQEAGESVSLSPLLSFFSSSPFSSPSSFPFLSPLSPPPPSLLFPPPPHSLLFPPPPHSLLFPAPPHSLLFPAPPHSIPLPFISLSSFPSLPSPSSFPSLPSLPADKLVNYKEEESQHIVVYRQGRWYRVEVTKGKRLLTAAELEHQFQQVTYALLFRPVI